MRLTRPVPLLTAAIGVVGANSLILPPVAAVVAADLGVDPSTIIRAMAAYGGGTALSALLLAPRADQIGADKALRQACVILMLALSLTALSPSALILIVAHGLAGIGAGMALPAIYGLAGQVGPKGQEKQTIGYVLTGWTLSLVGGVLIAAIMTDVTGWRSVYVLMTLLTAGIWHLLGRCDMQIAVVATTPTSPFTALRVPGLLRGLLSNAMLMLAFFGAYSYIGTHVVDVLGRSGTAAGLISMAYGAGYGFAALLNKYVDRLPRHQAMALAYSGLCLTYIVMASVAQNYGALFLAALSWGLFQHFGLNAVVARLNGLEPKQRGAIMGLNSATTYLCVLGGALSYRLPYEAGGIAACIMVSALCAALAIAEALWPQRVILNAG